MTEKKELVEDVRNLLEYAKSLGMTEVQTTDGGRQMADDRRQTTDCVQKVNSPADKAEALKELRAEIGDCKRCKLCKGRTNLVFGVGNPSAELMFIGEGPGRDEDLQGEPFVGRAGQLLTKIIGAMGYKRGDVYIGNVIKCRPPGNRNPEPDEVKACIPFLIKQAEIIAPRVIVCLGSVAAQNLLGTERKITGLRGNFTKWQGIPIMPTYHPAFLLRNPNMKRPVWEDMKKVMALLASTAMSSSP